MSRRFFQEAPVSDAGDRHVVLEPSGLALQLDQSVKPLVAGPAIWTEGILEQIVSFVRLRRIEFEPIGKNLH